MAEIIHTSGKQLTTLRKLHQKKYRYKYQLFVVEGVRASLQALGNSAVRTTGLFFRASSAEWRKRIWTEHSEIPFYSMEDRDFDEIVDAMHPQPVFALCEMPKTADIKSLLPAEGLLLALDRLQDPGNLGTIVRTAVWFGIQGLLLGSGTTDLFQPKVVRSSAGAIGSIPYMDVELTELLEELEDRGWHIVLLEDREGAVGLTQYETGSKTVLVVGNEGDGIADHLHKPGRTSLKISGASEVESLNVAVATGIALYEFSKKPNFLKR